LESVPGRLHGYRAGIFKKSMGARNRGGIGLPYRPARLHRLAELIPWNQFLEKYGLRKKNMCTVPLTELYAT
jgi:hypothetical protein